MSNVTPQFPKRAYRLWSADENQYLRTQYAAGASLRQIANDLGRSYDCTRARIRSLRSAKRARPPVRDETEITRDQIISQDIAFCEAVSAVHPDKDLGYFNGENS